MPRSTPTLPSPGDPPPAPPGRAPASSLPSPARPEPVQRPNLIGDIDTILGTGPAFRSAFRGYSRLQVDNYVRWAETELLTARRELDDVTARYGVCLADLEISRRLLAESPEGRELSRLSVRIGEILRLAADEAAERTASAKAEAESVLGSARTEADTMLHRAREAEESAVATADRLRAEAATDRDEASAVLEDARREAARQQQEAAAERARLDQEAAAERERRDRETAAERERRDAEAAQRRAAEDEQARDRCDSMLAAAAMQVAAIQAQLEDLRGEQARARESLDRFTAHLRTGMEMLAEGLPREVPVGTATGDQGARRHVITGNGIRE